MIDLHPKDFSLCREMEREGSAGACWKIWLRKHTFEGSEAEVAYAEEHAAREAKPVAVVPLPPPGEAPEAVAVDRPGPDQPAKRPKASPGAKGPKNAAKKTAPSPSPEASPEPSPEPSPDAPPRLPPAADRPQVVSGGVLDLCGLKPVPNATRFVKQRLVLFAPAQAARVESEPAIRAVGGGAEVRAVFASRFPLERFYNVVTTVEAKPGWDTAARLSLGELRSYVDASAVPKGAGGEGTDEADAEREKEFVRYSLGCADFIAAPNVTSHTAEWVEREVKTKKGTKKIRSLDVKLEGAMGIFRREGDGFVLVESVSASVPSMIDLATDATAGAIPDIDPSQLLSAGGAVKAAAKVLKLPDYISAIPNAACALKREVSDGVPTLGNCKEKAIVRPLFAAASIDERASDTCKRAYDESTPASEAGRLMATCEVRVRAFQLSRALQKEARSVEGWKLFAPLEQGTKDDREAWAFSLGKAEGVKTGWGFHAVDAQRERLAYFKAGHVGPGGEAGLKDGTELVARFGDAPVGSRVEEYPQLGLKITPWGGGALLAWNYGATTEKQASGRTGVWQMPTFLVGGGGRVGYDLSSLTGLGEFTVNVGAGYYAGIGGENVGLGLVPIDVSFEKGWSYRRLTFYLAVGETTTMVMLQARANQGAAEQSLSAVVVGAGGRLGFDIMMSPWAALRLEGQATVHFNTADYKDADDDKKPVINGFSRRADHYANFGPNLALAFTF